MTNDINQDLEGIRKQIADAHSRKTRAELMREQAQDRIRTSTEALQTSFKVETVDAARALADKLEDRMQQKIDEVRQALAEAADD